jgi:hypothetical protein
VQAARDAARASCHGGPDRADGGRQSCRRAREASVVAETAQVAAAEAAREVAHESEPVSVLISRKIQRLYVRQAFAPILESPVTILDADRPIGTHIFTAVERTNGETHMRWNVVSLNGSHSPGGVVESPCPCRKLNLAGN